MHVESTRKSAPVTTTRTTSKSGDGSIRSRQDSRRDFVCARSERLQVTEFTKSDNHGGQESVFLDQRRTPRNFVGVATRTRSVCFRMLTCSTATSVGTKQTRVCFQCKRSVPHSLVSSLFTCLSPVNGPGLSPNITKNQRQIGLQSPLQCLTTTHHRRKFCFVAPPDGERSVILGTKLQYCCAFSSFGSKSHADEKQQVRSWYRSKFHMFTVGEVTSKQIATS